MVYKISFDKLRQLDLKNPRISDMKAYEVAALVDTGALHWCIPQHVAIQLQLEELQKREVMTADASKHL